MESEGLSSQAGRSRPPADPDGALMGAIATGDRQAFAALYDRHGARVLNLGKRMLGPSAAEDLLHDVFLEVWHHASDYSAERGSVCSWLMVRTRSRALDRLGRRALDERVAEQMEVASSGGITVPGGGDRIDARRAQDLAGRLAPELVAVLDLAYFEGLSCSEIACRLDVPVGTVKSRLARALSQLREAIGFHEGISHG